MHGVFVFDHLFRTGAVGRAAARARVHRAARRGRGGDPAHLDRDARRARDAAAAGDAGRRARHRAAHRRAAPARRARRGRRGEPAEMETFGLPFGTEADRVMALRRHGPRRARTAATRSGSAGGPATSGSSRPRAPTAGTGGARAPEVFARELGEVQRLVERLGRAPSRFTPSWGGLVRARRDRGRRRGEARRGSNPAPNVLVGGPERVAEQLRAVPRRRRRAGSSLGPIDSSDPENAAILGELVLPLLDLTRPELAGSVEEEVGGGGEVGGHAVGVDHARRPTRRASRATRSRARARSPSRSRHLVRRRSRR